MFSELGIVLSVVGLVLISLVWVALSFLPRTLNSQVRERAGLSRSSTTDQDFQPAPFTSKSKDAVILVQPGGRVEYMSELARSVFDMREHEPYNLERLARRARPSEDFLDLCAHPGKKRITIGGKLFEIISYEVPGEFPVMLVTLRSKEISPLIETNDASEELLRTVTDFSQSIASSLDLDTAIKSILDNVSRLISADILEVKLWNAEDKKTTAYLLKSDAGSGSVMARAKTSQFGGFITNQLIEKRAPILIVDARAHPELEANGEVFPVQSYLGIPLIAGGELVGMIEAGQRDEGAFGQHDLDLLELVAGQAAVAIRNARIYVDEQKRAAELVGLANLNQSLGAVRETQELFGRLVESIAPLFAAEIVGFLLYDEDKRTLEGKIPFRGLPPHLVEIYRASIPANSPAEEVINSQKPVFTMNAFADETWRVLGLSDIALAASLRDNALVPLISSNRMLGYLQVGHYPHSSTPFSAEETRLINIVANQAAAIIENVLLVQQARARALRADALRRIASLAGSSATLEEILKYSMQELAHLFQADTGAIFLMDEARGELRLRRESAFGIADDFNNAFLQIYMDDPQYHYTVSGSKKPFMSGKLSADRRILPVYRPLAANLRAESCIVVPLITRDHSIGELMLGSFKPDHFNNYDVQIVSTAAGQLATAIESASLLTQTDLTLRQRVDQLTLIARVSREMGATLDPKRLLQVIHDEAKLAVKADCLTVFMFDENSAELQTQSFKGCLTQARMLTTLEETIVKSGEAQVIADYSQEGIFPPHDGVRSAIIAPISYQGTPLGLITLHSNRANFFKSEAIELIKALAVQAGVALTNARRYQTEKMNANLVRRRAETLGRLTDVSYQLDEDQPLDKALHVLARGIRESTAFRVVLMSIVEMDTGLLRRVTGVGIPQETMNELLAHKQPVAGVQQLMKSDFKVSRSYFIPADKFPVIPSEVHLVTLDVAVPTARSNETWHPEDMFLIPLESADGGLIGLISLDDPEDGLRPDKATIETIEVFASQASLLVNTRLIQANLKTRIESLTAGLQRQQKLLSVTQNDLPILLRKDLEQTISLHNLDRRAQRVRAGLAITESVSRQLDAASALLALGRETLTQLEMSVALVAENTADGARLIHVLGALPRSTNVESLFGQRNPLRACLQTGKPILISNLDENEEWRDASLLTSLRAKAVICLPVSVEGKIIAAMLAVNPEPVPDFNDEDRQVYVQISQQTSVILQNISLLNQTRRRLEEVNLLLDFSRQLTGLKPEAIVESLLESSRRVLQNAHAGVALLWNAQTDTLVPQSVSGYADNASMMKIQYHIGEALPGMTFHQKKSRRVDEINFARDYNLTAENLALYRQGTGGRFPVSSLLVPIVASGEGLGLLVLDNFNNAAGGFKPDDETLLTSLAQQVALSLDNLRLVQATQERAGLLQALNEASSSMTASLHSDELVKSLLDQFSPIIPYDTATLWMREKDRLAVVSTRGFPDTDQRHGLSISVSDSMLFKEMAQTGQPILVHDVREDHRFPPVENPRLSWIGIPLISKGELVGVLAAEKWQAHFYTNEQMQIGFAFASQSAVSLENARLYEDSVSRATELTQRTQRLDTLNRFASTLTGLLDADQIFNVTANELLQGLSVQRVSVVTFERGRAYWKTSSPRARVPLPRQLPDAPIFHRLRESLGIFNTTDIRKEAELEPLAEMLGENAVSLMALPLVSEGALSALIFIQTTGDFHFGSNELDVARTITNQATIALENARLYQSAARTAERFSILNEASGQISSSLDPEQVYVAAQKATERLMPCESFIITLLDEEKNEIDPVYAIDRGKRFASERVPFGRGLSSEVIQSGKPLLLSNVEEANDLDKVVVGEEGEETQSIVAVPMFVGSKALGMLSAQSYQIGVYTEEDVKILGTLANQVIVAIQNGQLFAETQNLAAQLEARVAERTEQLRHEQENTETLLRILTEVSSSLDLDRALNRTLSLLNKAIGAEQGTIMLLHAEDNLLHYRAGYGYLSNQPEVSNRGFTLRVGEGLAGWVVQNREAALIDDLYRDPRWVRNPASGHDHRSAIVVPMLVADDAIGVLMVFHREEKFFSNEVLNLVKAIASQVAVAINNAHLYVLIRDQAERLGLMLRKEQEEASRSQAILQAVADGVFVTSADNKITFVNASAEKVLGVKAEHMLGKSLDVFSGLFAEAATTWMDTIRRWSEDTSLYQPGDFYAEKLELGNGRIALVHLAPVILQNDFLGTVSIFRDITHEVEVDRLKSEFVATVSHELRTPMTAIKGYIDLLMLGATGVLNDTQDHFLGIVRGNIDRLNVLVDDLLDISRIEAGRISIEAQPIDLREVAQDILSETLSRSQTEGKQMELALDAPEKLPLVAGDSARVRQILDNLVDNAYCYTPQGGQIRVSIQQKDGELQVDVHDNGVGISAEDQGRIFDRFFRGEHPFVLATPGTGLGLPIVRELVEMHKGRLWMTSAGVPGKGSTFSFTLPIYKMES